MKNIKTRRAVFLDRDGVINSLIYHRDLGIIDSPCRLAEFRVLPRVPQAVKLLNDMGLAVVIVSNQPGIAKNHFGAERLEEFETKLKSVLKSSGARIDGSYYCLHHPEAIVKKFRKQCTCRKPGIGMLIKAAHDLSLSLWDSYMVGDGLTDVEAGTRAGCRTVFVGRWKCENCQFIRPMGLRPTHVANDLWDAAQWIRTDINSKTRSSKTVQYKNCKPAVESPCKDY
jgi:D-glycero-D-manno-heptose 1,7-bisphosphate phosphatase